jgi:hypothetical protein
MATDRTKARQGEQRFSGPIDKESALPIPQVAPKARAARRAAAERPAPTRWPRRVPVAADAAGREEYPGPRRSSTGAHIEPGQPTTRRRSPKTSGSKA